jgi:hypothetical protein
MPSPHAILQQTLLQRNNVRREQGHPLYAYRTTADELAALHAALRSHCASSAPFDPPTAAAFCVFGAEWFCRSYTGGSWAWRTILDAVGFRGTFATLYNIVQRGLAYWRRPLLLLGSERQFLVTLACEGGLPLGLLQGESGGALRRFFRELLGSREAYRRPARELVVDASRVLPPTLQQDVVCGLAAQLVDVISDLRLAAGGAADPMGYLDEHHPSWRERVPLRLEEDVARQLLTGLLREPRPPTVALVEIETRMCLEPARRFERLARFPTTMRSEDLEAQLALARGTIPPRTYLHLMTADAARFPVATATAVASEGTFDLASLPARPIRDPLAVIGRVLLVASTGSHDITIVQPPGGDELDDIPWVFSAHPQGGGHVLAAVGSHRTAADEVLLALPAEGTLSLEDGSTVDEVCEIGDPYRRVVRLRGRATWEGDGEQCAFRTKVEPEGTRPILVGSLRRFGFEGGEVWLGPPQWRLLRADGSTAELQSSFSQEWRPLRAGQAWKPLGPDCCGDVLVRLRRGGETITRTVITVLPRGVQFQVRPSHDVSRGRLEIDGLGAARIGIEGASGLRWNEAREGTKAVITVESNGPPPPTVDLRIQLDGGRDARVRVPFPSKMRRFLRGDHDILADHERLTLDRLSSVRARAIVEGTASGFVVEARHGDLWTAVGRLRRVSDNAFELALDTLRDSIALLLASSSDREATVQLRIVPEKGELRPPHPEVRVGRYDAHVAPERRADRSIDLVLDDASRRAVGPLGLSLLRVEARPIDDPSAPPVVIARGGEQHWSLLADQLTTGPWLVLGYVGEHARLRPLLLTIQGNAPALSTPSGPRTTFDEAVRLGPKERLPAIAKALQGMTSDLDHSAWLQVQRYLATLGHLPATTFDVVRALATVPDAAVAALLLGTNFDATWAGLEELPFSWALVPVKSWIRGVGALVRSVEAKADLWRAMGWDVARGRRERLAPFWERGPRQARFLATVLEAATMTLAGLPGVPQPLLSHARSAEGRRQLAHLLEGERTDLLLRHAATEDLWPEGDVRALAIETGVSPAVLDEIHVPPDLPHRRDVYNAPGVAAALSVLGLACPLPLLVQIRRLRSFDEHWFDFANAIALTNLLGTRFAENKQRAATSPRCRYIATQGLPAGSGGACVIGRDA